MGFLATSDAIATAVDHRGFAIAFGTQAAGIDVAIGQDVFNGSIGAFFGQGTIVFAAARALAET